jgi:xylulokinase
MAINAPEPGFAEQDPEQWYVNAGLAVREAVKSAGADAAEIAAVGIAYQMHGLVCVDKSRRVLRPAIIWCDSRAVDYGRRAFENIGRDKCLERLLNSPGNFTASKLAWVKDNEPEVFAGIDKIMLPGDWLAMRLTGDVCTTVSGLSEGIFWDFKSEEPAGFLLDEMGFDAALLPEVVPTFARQGVLSAEAAADFGLKAGTPVSYRAGDQPNNALSLNVVNPGDVAATAGTSGVVYGLSSARRFDPEQRVNTFAHVSHSAENPCLGVLLCINGTGILNSWTKRVLGVDSYEDMNRMAESVPAGSDGLTVLPFGNGAERMLGNRSIGAQFAGVDFNRHSREHICRAVQEGIVFAFKYGLDAMRDAGVKPQTIRAGFANMFMSDIFSRTMAGVCGVAIELYDSDGALGAARGAGIGAGEYASFDEAFSLLRRIKTVEPDAADYSQAYDEWKRQLDTVLD